MEKEGEVAREGERDKRSIFCRTDAKILVI